MQIDIELAITGFGAKQYQMLVKEIPPAYTVEDRSDTGYGLVVRNESFEGVNEISGNLEGFLEHLMPLSGMVRDHGCIVRVAVFSYLATTTANFSLNSLNALRNFNSTLEISVYPIDPEPG